MNTELQAALLRVVNQIYVKGVPKGYDLRERADILTNTHPTDDNKVDFLLYALYYCQQQSTNYQRSKIERDAFESIAETCKIEIKRLML